MKHPDEDTLLREVLELTEEEERGGLLAHLEVCTACREKLLEMRRETEALGGIDADIPEPDIRIPGRVRRPPFPPLAAAAVLLVGFLAGFGIARLSSPPEILLLTGYRSATRAIQSAGHFVVCESENLDLE